MKPSEYSYYALDRMLIEREAQKKHRSAQTRKDENSDMFKLGNWNPLTMLGLGR